MTARTSDSETRVDSESFENIVNPSMDIVVVGEWAGSLSGSDVSPKVNPIEPDFRRLSASGGNVSRPSGTGWLGVTRNSESDERDALSRWYLYGW